jgi:hypothetical protein
VPRNRSGEARCPLHSGDGNHTESLRLSLVQKAKPDSSGKEAIEKASRKKKENEFEMGLS